MSKPLALLGEGFGERENFSQGKVFSRLGLPSIPRPLPPKLGGSALRFSKSRGDGSLSNRCNQKLAISKETLSLT